MDLIVVGVLRLFPLEYVFLAFAAVCTPIVLLSFRLKKELGSDLELMRYEAILETEEVDRIAGTLFERLTDAGWIRRRRCRTGFWRRKSFWIA